MPSNLSRREFLKLSGLLTANAVLPIFITKSGTGENYPNPPNILVIVFDAWSAANTSIYGYPRKTTPHLERLADKGIVYHNHFSGGSFTTPGTASLLTGVLPWSHRAFVLDDTVHPSYAQNSIFHVFDAYHRIAYTHNPIANTLLRQFMGSISQYIPIDELYLDQDFLADVLFEGDRDIATVSINRALKQNDTGYAYSLYLSRFYEKYKTDLVAKHARIEAQFPRGIPNYDGISYFTLEQGIDGLLNQIQAAPQPFLGYYHFLPPHNPYKTRLDFFNQFAQDGYLPVSKPIHLLSDASVEEEFDKKRLLYDEFVLYVDSEFGRLYQQMETRGLLDNTWLIVTSDHGEMFERGILGHMTPSLHQPVIHTPLIIFPPRQTSRVDVYQTTSAIDILPTLANIAGLDRPSWAEGHILPPFAATALASKPDIFALQVGETGEHNRITAGTLMLVRERHKLIWFFGYEQLRKDGEMIELYNLEEDPQELNNLAPTQQKLTAELLTTAKNKLAEMDRTQ